MVVCLQYLLFLLLLLVCFVLFLWLLLMLSMLLLLTNINIVSVFMRLCRPLCPRRLRRLSATTRLLGMWVRIPPRAWISLCYECCVLSVGGLCFWLITRPEESYRMWCVQWVWTRSPVREGHDLESDRSAIGKKKSEIVYLITSGGGG